MFFDLPTHLKEGIIYNKFGNISIINYLLQINPSDLALNQFHYKLICSKSIEFIIKNDYEDILDIVLPDDSEESNILQSHNNLLNIRDWSLEYYRKMTCNLPLILCFIYDKPNALKVIQKIYPIETIQQYYPISLDWICYNNSFQILEYLCNSDIDNFKNVLISSDSFRYYSHQCIVKHSGRVWEILCDIYLKYQGFPIFKFQKGFITNQICADIKVLYTDLPIKENERLLRLQQDDLIVKSLLTLKMSKEILSNEIGIYLIVKLVAFAHNWNLIEEIIISDPNESKLNLKDNLLALLIGFSINLDIYDNINYNKHTSSNKLQNYIKKAWKSYWLKFNASEYSNEDSNISNLSFEYTGLINKTMNNLISKV